MKNLNNDNPQIDELKDYITILQNDISKLQVQLCTSEQSVRKLQELNSIYCKVILVNNI